jgi:serine/threonine-protein kinase HipA
MTSKIVPPGATTADATRTCYVYLHLPGRVEIVTCGRYEHRRLPTGEALGRFTYGRRYRERPDAVELDPFELPVAEGTQETAARGGVFEAIADAGPDAWGRRVIDKRSGTAASDVMDYLLQAPNERFGALELGHGPAPPPPVRPLHQPVRLEDLEAAARAIDESGYAAAPEAARVLLDEDSSLLGGMRPKGVVREDDRLWVAKFPSRNDRWSHAAVEGGMLRLAAACGIRVPATRVVTVGDRPVLLVERFDRERLDGGWARARAVSGLTVLRGDEGGVDRAAWSYLQLADELRRWVGPRADQDRRELFRRMVFNACISNTDDHPKNHALIAPRRDWHLAPAYDVTPSPSASVERDLAMVCGPWGRRATRQNLVAAGPRFGLSEADAAAVIETTAACVRARWAEEVRAMGGSGEDCARIASAFLPAGFEFVVDA